MDQIKFTDLVIVLRTAVQTGHSSIAPTGRVRMEAVSLEASCAYNAILTGDAFPCKESDRVKFVNEECITFVALGHGYNSTSPHAYIVSAFPQRAPKDILKSTKK